ncbi:MAG: PASTA domain-containing protein, partial [Clostridia bacterium]|nr:PASTA domain-containing protein [Clostridia bacterium]
DMTNSFISVPTVTGKTYKEAKALLESVSLSFGTVSGSLHPEDNDKVIGQAIPAGSMVRKNCPVSITVEKKEQPKTDDEPNGEETPNSEANGR